MPIKFTSAAEAALSEADRFASLFGRAFTGSEHILLGMLNTEDSIACKLLNARGINFDSVLKLMYETPPEEPGPAIPVEGRTPLLTRIIERSGSEAAGFGCLKTGTEHILLSVVSESECAASRLIIPHGVKLSEIRTDLISVAGIRGAFRDKRKKRDNPYLHRYGTDLCALAAAGRLDPVIGRTDETERIIRILCRKTKNNPCLIGEAGVGKTAIVEGIAQLITAGRAPQQLCGKTVFSVDISSMLSGSKYRGEFEERLKGVISEANADPDVILFIDEVHMIVGAGAAEGASDAANMLKPALGRGEIRLIGATTYTEYKKSIGADAALCRRFQPVNIAEPSFEDTLAVLKGLRAGLEKYHRVKITDEALDAAVRLSVRCMKDRFLPDKAIDVLDEACASFFSSGVGQRPDPADLLRTGFIKEPLNKVDADLIYDTVCKTSGGPRTGITRPEDPPVFDRLRSLIFGQDEALFEISAAINRMNSGLCGSKRPYASFLFYGPTGTGKTETCRAIAKEVCGSENALIRFDMSEYTEKHSISRLIGSPPGYVGYGESGLLTDAVRKRPFSVVCFDDADKAHPDIFGLLLQILEEGTLTDSLGVKADFSGSFVILTVNSASQAKKRVGGFAGVSGSGNIGFDFLPPELLGRFDGIIEFIRPDVSALTKIAGAALEDLRRRAYFAGVKISYGCGLPEFIAGTCDKEYGARSVRTNIIKLIEEPLSALITSENVNNAFVTVSDGKIVITAPKSIDKTEAE